jgi:hypothetical protein
MSTSSKRPSPLTMASEQDFPKESYLRDLKQNYARRKDNIELIKSNNILASVIRSLTEQLCGNGGHL